MSGDRFCPLLCFALQTALVDSGRRRATIGIGRGSCAPGRENEYLCLVHFEESKLNAMSKSEPDTLTDESLAYGEELRPDGHLIVGHALEPARTAMIVRVRNGKLSATYGPLAETKEQLGGFILIDAKDLNDAPQAAAKIPLARLGTIEMQPQDLA
jgi:hypothetical protein